jgi:hypothetical protein
MHVRTNLFLIGAQKAGTTSLHRSLAAHPSVFMCEPKEPCYFANRRVLDFTVMEELWGDDAEACYFRLFENGRGCKIVGESSTVYTMLPAIADVAQRIWSFNPDAKLIYLMRDPVERTLSHFWHNVKRRRESRPLLSAIRKDRRYIDVSNYAMQLRPYLSLFGREQVYTLTFEHLVANPAQALRELFGWLGVDGTLAVPNAAVHENRTPDVITRSAGAGILHAIRFSKLWGRAGWLVPSPLRRAGVRLAYARVERSAVPIDAAVEHLRAIQREHVAELSELLGRDFSEWSLLFATEREDTARVRALGPGPSLVINAPPSDTASFQDPGDHSHEDVR